MKMIQVRLVSSVTTGNDGENQTVNQLISMERRASVKNALCTAEGKGDTRVTGGDAPFAFSSFSRADKGRAKAVEQHSSCRISVTRMDKARVKTRRSRREGERLLSRQSHPPLCVARSISPCFTCHHNADRLPIYQSVGFHASVRLPTPKGANQSGV